ncbi:S49 family peptidase [Mangrovicoccus algicola]|uniref:S49 family peptidase n=1 Tax=Mangrovicoccus algicola TaxID=2771008 RepID=A0A8J7CUW8_9RHOB|nr:S49 family peptidase [Mangrovicoccus algicola]MBE3638054.1 S49 family peptidase [Mangrovicoccus algicola]
MKPVFPFFRRAPRVNVIHLQGVIAARSRGNALSDRALAPLIEKAFARGRPSAVALVVNSPGGSPVQSSLIGARIRRLSEEEKVPVHAFVEDVAASGGYWLASAADRIWADPCSVLGSIGVISSSFGAHELIARHGIERRVHTAGQSKSMLDPFRPEAEEDVARLDGILSQIHEAFIAQIRDRRGPSLAQDRDLFTGEVWIGQSAVDLGLADGIAHLKPKMQELFGEKVRFSVFSRRRGLIPGLGARIAGDLGLAIEERALYARYGL